MKRIAIIVVMVLMSLGASARSIHYFTYSQASRTVNYLNTQREIMIYCGYDYEIETYVLLNEVWMERVNSAYYELWVYGYDAYTGDEIYMPLDLQCVWLYSAGRMYNAAQYLRFRVDVRTPSLVWHIPPYNPYTRVTHRIGYTRTYHYDIHRHGWMPPAYTYGPGVPPPPLPYYYMRRPATPAPMPTARWTPGASRPTVPMPTIGSSTATNPSAGDTRSHNASSTRNKTTPTTSATPAHNSQPSTPRASTSRSRTTSTSSDARSRTSSTTTPTRSSSTTTHTRSSSTSTTPTRSSATSSTATRSSASTSTTPTRSSSTSSTTPTRSSSATTTNSSSRSRAAATTSPASSTRSRSASSAATSSSNNDKSTSTTRSSSSTRNSSSRTRTR